MQYEEILELLKQDDKTQVEKVLENADADIIIKLINNGQAQDYYDVWKDHENEDVAIALARKGLYSDMFAKDKRCDVRAAVVVGNQSYIPKLMKRTIGEWYTCFYVLSDAKHPDPEVLKSFIGYKHKKCDDITKNGKRRFRFKYESLVRKPTQLESVMTPYELYAAKNPLWVRDISINQITRMEEILKLIKKEGNEDLIESIFDKLLITDNTYDMKKYIAIMRDKKMKDLLQTN